MVDFLGKSSIWSMTSNPSPEDKPLRSFGRTKGRPLSGRKQALVDSLLPKISIPVDGIVDPRALIPGKSEYNLEIGFGGGEHLTGQAITRSDAGFLGVEPFLNGVAKALGQIDDQGLSNVRLLEGDARDVMARMPDGCLDRIYLLFPDPWPKTRHAKRRLIQDETVAEFVRVLKLGGRLRVATDVKSYADHALFVLRQNLEFKWLAVGADDWRKPPTDHLTTRYETKKLGNCAPVFFEFKKI